MTTITACTNRRAHRHALPELRAINDRIVDYPRYILDAYIRFHEQPDARRSYRSIVGILPNLTTLDAFVSTYLPELPRSFWDAAEQTFAATRAAALSQLEADEAIAAVALAITGTELRARIWNGASDDADDRVHFRNTLALLRAGVLHGPDMKVAVRDWGTTAWEDLTTFQAPPTTSPRGRNGLFHAAWTEHILQLSKTRPVRKNASDYEPGWYVREPRSLVAKAE